jgi:hypothetical protein
VCCLAQGYMIANGVMDPDIDGNAVVNFARDRSLISDDLYIMAVIECRGALWEPPVPG